MGKSKNKPAAAAAAAAANAGKRSPTGKAGGQPWGMIALTAGVSLAIAAYLLLSGEVGYEKGFYTGVPGGFVPPGRKPLGVAWQPNPQVGWGTFGLHLIHESAAAAQSPVYPLLLQAPHSACFRTPYPNREAFGRIWEKQRAALDTAALGARTHLNFPVLHAVPEAFFEDFPVWGSKNVGACFLERFNLKEEQLARARSLDLILAGSSWNAQRLRQLGLRNVVTAIQGVDLSLFAPFAGPGPVRINEMPELEGKFVVFSGGKLELRKGQDLVVVALREFVKRHPDTVLLTAWHNAWPEVVDTLKVRSLVSGVPRAEPHPNGGVAHLHIREWLAANGVPLANSAPACDRGALSRSDVAALLKRADAAVFPNRCEGGTNLVAMETMATGVPTVISNNTGHVDIVGDGAHCYPLTRQVPFSGGRYEGWAEVTAEEIVEQLEKIYQNRAEAKARGLAASAFMQQFSWERSIQNIHRALLDYHIY